MSDVAETTALDRIMRDMAAYGSEFAGTYANHAPMVLVALDRIGGGPERLEAFFAHYRDGKRLPPFPEPVTPLGSETWRKALGERTREADLRAFFRGEVARLGVREALRSYLPALAPGVAASAFHALMRLAYALLRDDADEVAISLAYWAATYLPLPPAAGVAPITDDPAEVLARVAKMPALRALPVQEMLWKNMAAAGRTPEFAPVVDWLKIDSGTRTRMAQVGLALFADTQDFVALHVVTGLHWLRVVEPFNPAADVCLRHFWQGVAGLMGEMGFPAPSDPQTLARLRRLSAPSWPEIMAVAAASSDEHDISLVFSASEEERVYGDPLYRIVAARRVGLVLQ